MKTSNKQNNFLKIIYNSSTENQPKNYKVKFIIQIH